MQYSKPFAIIYRKDEKKNNFKTHIKCLKLWICMHMEMFACIVVILCTKDDSYGKPNFIYTSIC